MGLSLRSPVRGRGFARTLGPRALIAVSAIVALLMGVPAAALAADEDIDFGVAEADLFGFDADTFFGMSDEDLFGAGEDALFGGGDLLVEVEAAESSQSLADELLVSDGIEFGGTYNVGLNVSWPWSGRSGGPPAGNDEITSRLRLSGNLYADYRPNRDFRLFAKGRVEGESLENDLERLTLTPKLTELFADFHSDNRVFFRVGKQMIHWGVGYFFSPADIINIGRIDPENPDADREGPVALKANLPVGSDNYYVHVIADSVAGQTQFALAPKAEWVVGGTEIGLGTYYRADRAPRVMTTLSGSLGKVSFFGEGVLSFGSDKRFLQADPSEPLGVKAVRRDEQLFAHATVGMRHGWNDPEGRFNVMAAAQYYFNGEGYAAGELEGLFENNPLGVRALIEDGEWSFAGMGSYPGRHYGALSLNWPEAFGSRLSPGLFWLGNLQDNSGMATLSVGIKTWEKVRLSVGVSRTYAGESSLGLEATNDAMVFGNVSFSGVF